METNKAHHDEEVVPGVTLGQMKEIHDMFQVGLREGEFMIPDYQKAMDIENYDRAKVELNKAFKAGLVTRRKRGIYSYYRFTTPSPSE